MKTHICLLLAVSLLPLSVFAQNPASDNNAAKNVQPSPASSPTAAETSLAAIGSPPMPSAVVTIAPVQLKTGTRLDIESAYTVSSLNVHRGDLLTFRVLAPVHADGVVVIEPNALVTARVTEAKRGGHWGKSGRLVWTMVDVDAIDGTRVPIQIANPVEGPDGGAMVKGTSHTTEVATKTIIMGALLAPLFPIAPLTLMHGFKRGEDAVIPEGRRFVVYVSADTTIQTRTTQPSGKQTKE